MADRFVSRRATVLICATTVLLALGAGDVRAQARDDGAEWTRAGRLRAYAHDLYGPGALIGVAAASAIDQVREEPSEWGDGAEGFGRRAASNAGTLVVQETVRHGVAIALGRSTRYHPCNCRGAASRVRHALVESATDRDRSGRRALSVARVAGAFAGAYAQPLWRPDLGTGEAALRAASSLAFGALGNVAKELVGWPR